jgi:hypothetical protein
MTTNSTWAALRNPAFRKDFAGGCLNEGRELEEVRRESRNPCPNAPQFRQRYSVQVASARFVSEVDFCCFAMRIT